VADQGAQIAGEVLAAIRLELNQRIIPALSDPDALHSAKMAEDILSHLSGWILFGRDISDEVVADFREMADETATTQFIDDYLLPSGPLGTFREPLQDAIEAGNTGLLKPAAAAERKMFAAEARAIDRAADEAETRLEASERVVGPALATAFLEAVLGPGHRVTAVSRAPGGYSKDTLFFAGIAPDGSELPLVIRRDLPFGPGETTVVDEFHLIEGLADAGFPVARPLALDPSGILGKPAMISERVGGRSGTAEWAGDPSLRDRISATLGEVTAQLHRIDPSDFGLAEAGQDPRAVVRDYVLEWQERWRRNRLHPSPALAAGFAWLLANIPDRIDHVSIVHGDIGFHNTMVADGDLIALLDWEFAHLGDATEDLSYCRPFIEDIGGWDVFMEAYSGAGGPEYREQNARYFNVWRSVRNATSCATAWRGFASGRYPALKMVHQGIPLYRRFIREVVAALELVA